MDPVAVIGIGQTKHARARGDLTLGGLVRQAAVRALEDAELSWSDIDAVFLGTAPDMFEGVMMPELYLADALEAVGKPLLRVHTAGSVGGSTAVVAAHAVSTGWYQRVLAVTFEKQSESEAMWALSPYRPFEAPMMAGAGGYFSPFFRAYISAYDVPEEIGILSALKDRTNALRNPYAHVQIPDISFEMIAESAMLWDPTRLLESCPSSDGACAMVLGDDRAAARSPRPPAWIHATSVRSEPFQYANRDYVHPPAARDCAVDLYRQAGIVDPLREFDCAEVYVPFSWFEPLWLEAFGFAGPGKGWQLTESGATALDGEIPWNMSGGVLSTNPIGAAGMLRLAEAALQVRHQAGDHQVPGAHLALGHAFGGLGQFHAAWIVGSSKP